MSLTDRMFATARDQHRAWLRNQRRAALEVATRRNETDVDQHTEPTAAVVDDDTAPLIELPPRKDNQ